MGHIVCETEHNEPDTISTDADDVESIGYNETDQHWEIKFTAASDRFEGGKTVLKIPRERVYEVVKDDQQTVTSFSTSERN